ncbi:beta family protein [Paramaledivibacter caminithermalis]|uniref:Beta protein n=1 Tax=Paramaledivibacter caminithermalis (strain DSM 15212 / CIP 107654 / DViRD3) TaxID=1121301 RepID=A0A1M6TYT7_PARC5|nr:beta family protein [Paramaledivibacter caminithermalis]SHK62044.1 Beta protein [Paramaledivibacter caminithermalis DSM 15212]
MRENFYLPILKWKMGEQKAVEELPDILKDRIIPLFEIPPIEWDYENECYKKTIDQHLEKVPKTIKASWGLNRPFFVDMPYLTDETDELTNGLHALEHLHNELIKEGLSAIPTVYCTDDDYILDIVKDVVSKNVSGVCIRIKEKDLLELEELIENLLNKLNINEKDVDLIIDLAYIPPIEYDQNLNNSISIIRAIPDKTNWRSISLCGTSIPESMSDVEKDSLTNIPRLEYKIWKYIFDKAKDSKYIFAPNFGDYCVQNPSLVDMDPRIMKPTPNIRYTIDNDYMIVKGHYIKKKKYTQCNILCKKIINHPKYMGKNFSWGDKYIYECGNNCASTGNGTTWRKVGTNHHISFVIDQLSKMF